MTGILSPRGPRFLFHRACTRATFTRALARFAEPFCFLAVRRWASASRARSRGSMRAGWAWFGPG